MKYIPEPERKFTDEIAVKTYRSLARSDFKWQDGRTWPWMSLDQRIILPVKEKVRREFTTPGTVIVIAMLAGKLNYADSFGFKRKLVKGTLLVMTNQSGRYEYQVKNSLNHTDAEFIEIEMGKGANYDGTSFLQEGGLPDKNILYRIISPSPIKILAGQFDKGFVHPIPEFLDHMVIFVVWGELWVNGLSMTAKDTVLIECKPGLSLEFTKDSAVMLFKLPANASDQ
ncbi:hypothetical protein [Pedobacter ginsengisoli]|uniref:hypothetical protein n=1 Tax=Pedobacter ginsengisoli TaxID=363852 RepID=UPI00254AC10B|nr:hypothetical protein [Pedobacter ginsengisoli]